MDESQEHQFEIELPGVVDSDGQNDNQEGQLPYQPFVKTWTEEATNHLVKLIHDNCDKFNSSLSGRKEVFQDIADNLHAANMYPNVTAKQVIIKWKNLKWLFKKYEEHKGTSKAEKHRLLPCFKLMQAILPCASNSNTEVLEGNERREIQNEELSMFEPLAAVPESPPHKRQKLAKDIIHVKQSGDEKSILLSLLQNTRRNNEEFTKAISALVQDHEKLTGVILARNEVMKERNEILKKYNALLEKSVDNEQF